MGDLHGLPQDFESRFVEEIVRSNRKFNRRVEAADPDGDVCGMNLRSPWDDEVAIVRKQKQAALKYLGDLVLFVLTESGAVNLQCEQRLNTVNQLLTFIRQDTLDHKWPTTPPIFRRADRQQEREFDLDLIAWLGSRDEWKKYEFEILPALQQSEVILTEADSPDPRLHMGSWPVGILTTDQRQLLTAGLLEAHGRVLDENHGNEIERWRRAYDLISEVYAGAGLLSDELVREEIPKMVGDAASGGGWSDEPFGRIHPSAVFSVHFGSRFYPVWRVATLVQALHGREAHWSGRVSVTAAISNASPRELTRPQHPLRDLKFSRREIINSFARKNHLNGWDGASRHLGVSETALRGMVRGDRTRYSEETLSRVLEAIGCTRSRWDGTSEPVK